MIFRNYYGCYNSGKIRERLIFYIHVSLAKSGKITNSLNSVVRVRRSLIPRSARSLTRHRCVIPPRRFIQLEVFHTKVKRVVTIVGQALSAFFFRSKLWVRLPPLLLFPLPSPSTASNTRRFFVLVQPAIVSTYIIFFFVSFPLKFR